MRPTLRTGASRGAGSRPVLPLLLLAAATATPAQSPADAVLATASRRDDSALVAGARDRPDSARAAIARLMALAAAAGADSVRVAPHLAGAHDLARAYAVAWRDSFL